MKNKSLLFLFCLIMSCTLQAQKTLAEKLGYGPEAKLLIIHADDLGMAHAQNKASILAMKVGMVNSASIMMPCPWVPELAEYVKENPMVDFGLHLTLTSEWKYMRWGPLASKDKVSSLINEWGYLYPDCPTFAKNAKPEHVEIELRAQIEQAIRMGINPTHLDTHMGCLVFSTPEIFETYLNVAREYKIPAMVDRFFLRASSDAIRSKMTDKDVIVEKVLSAEPKHYESGMDKYYEDVLTSLTTGIQVLLIHPGFNNAEMQGVSVDHPMWGADWRQQDFDFFTSEKCRKIMDAEKIQLITWRQIQEAMYGE